MSDTKQPVEGGKLLDALMKLFFKGIDNLFNSYCEYVEENGILKQVSRISIISNDTDDRYTLTIKLSPVKDREDIYYVEAETDAPNFDVSSINQKTMRLNADTSEEINKIVDNLLAKNKLTKDPDQNSEEQTDAEEEEKEDDGLSPKQKEEIDETEEAVREEIGKSKFPITTSDGKNGHIVVVFIEDQDRKVCALQLSSEDDSGNELGTPVLVYEIDTVDRKGNVIKFNEFYNKVKDYVRQYANDTGLKIVQSAIGSTVIDAKLVKASDSSDIELVAINASCKITSALNTVTELAQSDEFVDMIGEDPTSIRITDDGESYELEEIEDVDTSGTYDQLFADITTFESTLKTYRWALGFRNWCKSLLLDGTFCLLDNMIDQAAQWVIINTDHYPIPSNNIIENTLTELKDNSGKLSIEQAETVVEAMLNTFLECLDGYYVNLKHEEQSQVDDWINQAKNLLVYS